MVSSSSPSSPVSEMYTDTDTAAARSAAARSAARSAAARSAAPGAGESL